MKIRITFESPTRVIVCTERNWLERALSFFTAPKHGDRAAELWGWQQQWFWVEGGRLVPDDVDAAIDRAWARVGPVERELLAT